MINGALALLLVAGVGVAYLSLHDDAGASSPGRIVRVSRGNIVSSVSASGSVASANSRDLAFGASGTVDAAKQVGKLVGERAKAAGVEAVVFDRGGNQYHGRVAGIADGAREAGLTL